VRARRAVASRPGRRRGRRGRGRRSRPPTSCGARTAAAVPDRGGLTARPRALAIVDDRHTLVATDDAVVEIGPHGVARPCSITGSDALAVCGGVALALASDGAWTWTGDARPQRVGDRPPRER
jgi:hypothetical protein